MLKYVGLNGVFERVNTIEWHLLTLNDKPKESQDTSLYKSFWKRRQSFIERIRRNVFVSSANAENYESSRTRFSLLMKRQENREGISDHFEVIFRSGCDDWPLVRNVSIRKSSIKARVICYRCLFCDFIYSTYLPLSRYLLIFGIHKCLVVT